MVYLHEILDQVQDDGVSAPQDVLQPDRPDVFTMDPRNKSEDDGWSVCPGMTGEVCVRG